MNKKILLFNVFYYTVIVFFVIQGKNDPSSSLGYGYFIIAFWIIAGIILAILLIGKTIRPRSIPDKIGIFTATPVLSIICIMVILSFKDRVDSEWVFNSGNYRYRIVTIDEKMSGGKRIECYRSAAPVDSSGFNDSDNWVKDSTWIYLSEKGDTLKKVKYKNDREIK